MKRSIESYRGLARLILKQVYGSGKVFTTSQVETNQNEILYIVTSTGFRFLKYDKVKRIIISEPNKQEREIIEELRKELELTLSK